MTPLRQRAWGKGRQCGAADQEKRYELAAAGLYHFGAVVAWSAAAATKVMKWVKHVLPSKLCGNELPIRFSARPYRSLQMLKSAARSLETMLPLTT